ncbi:helix-turn-helix domain-containing protein [Micromonospora sp. DT233]|uniref:helix-turn-helix domain-containing protein n=1 Tax=Micromonospora sp. DT233 TaxID=3393432 RepID=UPI003CF9F03D
MTDLPAGRRMAYWRDRRGMSQQTLADALGKSKSWVDKVERGVRRLDKLSNLQDIARALRIDVQLLLDTDPPPAASPGTVADRPISDRDIDAVRAALFRCATPTHLDRAHTPPAELDRSAEHAWLAFQHADYRQLLRTLPDLLRGTQLNRAAHPGARTCHLLGQAHQLTSAVLGKVGETGMAWLAADRAITICQDADDELLAAAATVQLARVLRALGHPRDTMEVAITAAQRLAPTDPRTAPPSRLSWYGTLLLQAAAGAAGCGARHTATELLDQADETAALLGEDRNERGISFGPVVVDLARVTTTLDLSGRTDALALHRKLVAAAAFQQLPKQCRAAYLVDVAGQCVRLGDLPEAGRALLLTNRVAPTEIRHRPAACDTLRAVVRRSTRPAPEIIRLAETLRIAV